MPLKKLKEKHIKYAKLRLKGQSPEKAAINAGFSITSARQQGYKLAKDPLVLEYMEKNGHIEDKQLIRRENRVKNNSEQVIKRIKTEKEAEVFFEQFDVTQERAIAEAYNVMTQDPIDILDSDGKILPLNKIPKKARHTISSIKVTSTVKNGEVVTNTEVKFYDRLKAIDTIIANTEKAKQQIKDLTEEELNLEIEKLEDKMRRYNQ